jgi:peptide/nickel transport system substrate-binding protein
MNLGRRQVLAGGTVAALMASLTACGAEDPEKDVPGGVLHVGPLPDSIDPVATTQRVVGIVAASVCEGLFENTKDLAWKPGLLKDWDYDKDTTYRFHLRSGVTFHDGSTMTSEDVVASLDRYAASAPGATFGSLVDSIRADGDSTVVLTLTHPSAAVPALLATPDSAAYIMPASAVKNQDPNDALQHLVGTGPYVMDTYVPDQTVELSQFKDYTPRTDKSDGASGAKKALAGKIVFIPTEDSNALNLLRTEAVDVQSQLILDQAPSVDSDPTVRSALVENGSFPLLQLNTKAGPLKNQTLRQALLAAVDAQQVMAVAAPSKKYYSLDSSLMPPGSPWYSTAGHEFYNQADVARSKELQAKAGYNGEKLRMIYQTTDIWATVAIQQLSAAGFSIDAVPLDGATLGQRRTDPEKWEMLVTGGTSYGDPLTVVFMGSGFPGWWNTKEKKALMDEFLSAPTQKERKAIWEDLQALIYEQVPFIRFGGRSQLDALAPTVDDYPIFPGSARGFYNISLTK